MENKNKKQAKITGIVYTPIKTWDYLTETREYQAWDDYCGDIVSTDYYRGAKTIIEIYGIPNRCRNERIIRGIQKCVSDEKENSIKELRTLEELVKTLGPYKARFLKIARRLSEKYNAPLIIKNENGSMKQIEGGKKQNDKRKTTYIQRI